MWILVFDIFNSIHVDIAIDSNMYKKNNRKLTNKKPLSFGSKGSLSKLYLPVSRVNVLTHHHIQNLKTNTNQYHISHKYSNECIFFGIARVPGSLFGMFNNSFNIFEDETVFSNKNHFFSEKHFYVFGISFVKSLRIVDRKQITTIIINNNLRPWISRLNCLSITAIKEKVIFVQL